MPSFADIYTLYSSDFQKVVDQFKDENEDRETSEYIDEYKGERSRRSTSVGKRENKIIGEGDSKKSVEVARLVFQFPKKIVRTAVGFLFGGEMNVTGSNQDEGLNEFKRRWGKELKMHGVIKEFARTVMVETKAAILFYPVQKEGDKESKLRTKLLNLDAGDFYPHFDDYGDMDAFLWRYKAKDIKGKEVECVNIYTAEFTYSMQKGGSGWEPKIIGKNTTGIVENLFKKIPVVYAEQSEPEWEEIVTLMDNFEMRISRLSDTNSYFAEPLLKLFGKAETLPGKESTGKAVNFPIEKTSDGKTSHGDAAYLTWDQTPESIKLELETMWSGVFSMSSTPDLSFDSVKGLGSGISGIAMKLMFMDAILKASDREDLLRAVQRMVSVVSAGIANITNIALKAQLEANWIEVDFGSVLPDDIKEAVEVLMQATGDKPILSQQSGVALSPLTKDSANEITLLKQQADTEAATQGSALIGSYQ